MTPKEKCDELIDKFIEDMPPLANQTGKKIIDYAKQAALIAVEEIMNCAPLEPTNVDWDDCGATHKHWYEERQGKALNFWNSVKTEILNL